MATATTPQQRLKRIWDTPNTIYGWLSTVDHKLIGKRYLVTAFIFLLIGGIEALFLRTQLATPEGTLLGPEAYDQMFSMHGITMIFWYASPILAGFANYLIPLLFGARDMAFPRLNAFTYWTFLLSGLFLYVSVPLGIAPRAGWFSYVPYAGPEYSPLRNMDFYALSLIFLTVSTTAGAINFIVSIFRLRAPGMSIGKMPLFGWSTLTTSFSIILSLPALTAALLFLELDRRFDFHFYDAALGGDPLLWQQTFWFFAHPWVYIIFLPATGMISMILPVMSRRPIVGYAFVAVATVMTGVLGFGVWVHHMFATGQPAGAYTFFSAASMTIAIASAVQFFAWIATMWTGRPVLKAPMLFCLGFMGLFLIGGINGVITAVIPFDWQVHDSYFVVSHLHYVLVGANVFPVFAALYYWGPKMTGKMMDERLGAWSFWLMFLGANLAFFPMHITGLLGMPRRLFTYPAGMGWTTVNLLSSIGAFLLASGVLVTVWNWLATLRSDRIAGPNPWNADTLEWSTSSPPEVYGSVHIPTVKSRHPMWDPHEEEHDPDDLRILDHGRLTLTTTWLDGEPDAIAVMPEDTLWPLGLAIVIGMLLTGVLLESFWLIGGGFAATLVSSAIWLYPRKGAHQG